MPPLIPREVLFGNPRNARLRISPGGTRIAYLAPDDREVLQVWVRTIGQADDHMVTADPRRGVFNYFWTYDSQQILYLQDSDGDENYHIFSVDLTGGNLRDLTPFNGVKAALIAYYPQHPQTMLVGMNQRDPTLFDVYRLDLTTGELTMDTRNPGDVDDWAADRQLRVRGATSETPDGGGQLRVRADASSEWRTVTSWGPDDNLEMQGFTGDGGTLYLGSNVGANAERLVALNLASMEQTVLAADPQYDIGDTLVHPVTGLVQAAAFERDTLEWQVLDPAIADDMALLSRFRRGEVQVTSRDLEDRIWTVAYIADDAPSQFYLYTRGADPVFVFSARPELDSYRLAQMQPISYQARDGLTVHGYLTLPVGEPATQLPTVVLVHGGPQVRDEWGYDPEVQWLANRGYAVLQVNYRGSAGYGKDFLNAGNGQWGAKMSDDLVDGVGWLIDQGIAHPRRVGIMGTSYGGYATLAGLTFNAGVYSVGVDLAGPSSLVTLLNAIPPYWEVERASLEHRIGGSVANNADFLQSRSPLFFADRIRAPLFIGQGANDPRVKQAEAEQMVAAVRAAGQPVTYVLYPDEGHGLARAENRLQFYGLVEPFLAQYLGGRAEQTTDIPGATGIVQ
jgi:dipeptidyl aminopeptidase/acylaminoacyl peptidase